MKFFLIALTFCFYSTHSFAEVTEPVEIGVLTETATVTLGEDPITEVKSETLKLAGRGFMSKKTHESVSIACVGVTEGNNEPSCETLRFVYFNPDNQKAFYIGRRYEVKRMVPEKKARRMSDDEQRVYTTKKMMKFFKSWRRDHRGLSEETRHGITAGSFILIVGGCGYASMFGTAALSMGVSLAAYPLYLVVTPIITGDIKLMNGNNKITSAVADQNGWNWSSRPSSIQHKVFNQLFDYLSIGEPEARAIRVAAETYGMSRN